MSLSDFDSFAQFMSHRIKPTKQNEMHPHDHVRILPIQNFAFVVSAKKIMNKANSAEIDLYISRTHLTSLLIPGQTINSPPDL